MVGMNLSKDAKKLVKTKDSKREERITICFKNEFLNTVTNRLSNVRTYDTLDPIASCGLTIL